MSTQILTKEKTKSLFNYLKDYLDNDLINEKQNIYFGKVNYNDLDLDIEISFSYLKDNWKSKLGKIKNLSLADHRYLINDCFSHKSGIIESVSVIRDNIVYGVRLDDSKLVFIESNLVTRVIK